MFGSDSFSIESIIYSKPTELVSTAELETTKTGEPLSLNITCGGLQ